MPKVRGEDHPCAKLTDKKAIALVQEYRRGKTTHRKLAVKYGINQASVRQVLTGRSWSHITGIHYTEPEESYALLEGGSND